MATEAPGQWITNMAFAAFVPSSQSPRGLWEPLVSVRVLISFEVKPTVQGVAAVLWADTIEETMGEIFLHRVVDQAKSRKRFTDAATQHLERRDS